MTREAVTLHVPERLLIRLRQAAEATRRPLNDVILRSLEIGSPPCWDDAPPELQADLAALDRLDDERLWLIARRQADDTEMVRCQQLLDMNANDQASPRERDELEELRNRFDSQMLLKAQAVALLRWRGHPVPPDLVETA